MIARMAESPPVAATKADKTFVKQSTWMMAATVLSGMLFAGVHVLSKKIPEEQYSAFVTLLMVTGVLPAMPLQMMYAQQTTSALIDGRKRRLSGIIRHGLLWSFLVCAAAAVLLLVFQGGIASRWQLDNPIALWITLATVLSALWMPMLVGILQGRQDFLSMGNAAILVGLSRLILSIMVVYALSAGATGMMIAALIGNGLAILICLWRSRDLWTLRPEPFDRRALWRKMFPLLCGFGVSQFMFTGDTMFAKAFFGGAEMAPYSGAGTMSRAVLWLVMPLAAVMFPKIVHSAIKAEKTNLLKTVLLGTAVLSVISGAVLCALARVAPWVVTIVYPENYVPAIATLLPWYIGAMIPLTLANVLINDLMARERFRFVPAMVALAVAYAFALPFVLNHFSRTFETVLQTLGAFNLLLLIVCAWAAFGDKVKDPNPASAT
jgi:O-antigen/teichoic acid export membrane protein